MRQIAREMHHSRKTTQKAIYGPPVYTRSKAAPKRTIGPLGEIIRRLAKKGEPIAQGR